MTKVLASLVTTALLSTTMMAKEVSTYLYADFKSSDAVKSSLESKGFNIVGEYDAMSNPDYHVIAFTNDTLKAEASKKERGFAAVEKVLVSAKDKKLVFTNPEYFLHAFMQDDYKEATAKSIEGKIASAFGKLQGSTDGMDDDDLAGYHFMMGMPYYEDMIELAEGKDLLAKLEKNGGDNIVFKVKLKNATLVGVAMPTANGEKSYLPKIKGEKHAAFLPYMVLIEGDTAKMLHAKYYLAVAFPKLSMGDFMSISSTPGDIEDYLKSLLK